MGFENLTTFTEVDPNSVWVQTATKCTGTNVRRDDDSYVYKDYGVNNFGDYEFNLELKITAFSGSSAFLGLFAVSNSVGSAIDMTEGQRLLLFSSGGVGLEIQLQDRGNSNIDIWSGFTINTLYYIKMERVGSAVTCKIYGSSSDRENDTNILANLSITGQTTQFRYLLCGTSRDSGASASSTMSGYIENINTNPGDILIEETLSLSEDVIMQPSLEQQKPTETLNLSEDIQISLLKQQEFEDILSLSEDIELDLFRSHSQEENLTLSEEVIMAISEFVDINNKIRTVKGILKNINNKFRSVIEVFKNSNNIINTVKEIYNKNVNNDIRTLRLDSFNVNNDIRFLKSWQSPGDAGFQSLGKEYIKIYIDSVEQTDVDIDSINIEQTLNAPHTASFNLGRQYDATKPDIKSEVEIKYHIWTLYKGYIIAIMPGDSPESISIRCQDKHWERNNTKKYFNVGHKPQDNLELYYSSIQSALSNQISWSLDIGQFVPQTINCFGTGESDCITSLISSAGNYGWFYKINKGNGNISKELWTAERGDIVNIESQAIGKNIGIYQILEHQFEESIENLVNKYRVQMGEKVIRRFNEYGGTKDFTTSLLSVEDLTCSPDWDSAYETLAINSPTGYGIHYPDPENEEKYSKVFTNYKLPYRDISKTRYSGVQAPKVRLENLGFADWTLNKDIKESFGGNYYLSEGFTIDFDSNKLIFNEPIYFCKKDEEGREIAIRRPNVFVMQYKEDIHSNTEDESDDPETDISNPMMFFTNKVGDYPETILSSINLAGLSIQYGARYISGEDDDGDPIYTLVPSWNDTAFAVDMAYWELSKIAHNKIRGKIDLTIDAMCFYDLDLSKRIMIDGIIENPLNIKSISYNIGSWKTTVTLENDKYYRRTVSLQSRGE